MSRYSRRGSALSAEDLRLWRQAMRDVDPLPGAETEAETLLTEAVAERVGDPRIESRLAESLRSGTSVEAVSPGAPSVSAPPLPGVAGRSGGQSLPPLEIGRPAGVDRRTDARLRRGKLTIEGRIDLHGLTRDSAHSALTGFLSRSQRDGKRCVLVITGKGSRRGEDEASARGVLRQAVPRWLDQAPLRAMVLAVHRAQPRDGGDGALYVLLKKRVQAGSE